MKGSGIMKRNHEIKIRFNEKEFEQLTEKVRKSKLSRENFVRQCILKKSIKEPPHLDYYKLLNEFNHIGNNLNQIAKSLNSGQDKSSFLVEVTIEELRNMIKNLDEKVRGD